MKIYFDIWATIYLFGFSKVSVFCMYLYGKNKKFPGSHHKTFNFVEGRMNLNLSISLSVILKIVLYGKYLSISSSFIIMSCRQHGYPWPSLATSSYHSSPPAGLQGYILCLHIAAVCRFELVVLLLLGHMWGSCVSGSSNLYSFRDGRQVAV